ncbi:hypothetical protein [Roseibium album]|uniref:hypothetical protein n=1 Tax=Roseibium album TaxID=311410 RepID=UPI00249338EC|nr:hypothetical protein [Roseibium album]
MSHDEDNAIDWRVALETLTNTIYAIRGFCTLLNTSLVADAHGLQPDAEGITTLLSQQVDDLKMLEPILRDEFKRIRAEKLSLSDADTIARLAGARRQTVERVIWAATGIDLSTTRERAKIESEGGASRQVFNLVVLNTLAVEGFMDVVSEVSGLPVEPLRKAFSAAVFIDKSDLEATERTQYVAEMKVSVENVLKRRRAEAGATEQSNDTPKEKRDQMIANMSDEGMDPADIAQAVNLKRSTVERVISKLNSASGKIEGEPGDKAVNE